jgi:hypothetical protein
VFSKPLFVDYLDHQQHHCEKCWEGRGIATAAIQRALDFFHEQGDVDFELLVCEPALILFYERLGWQRFAGDHFVTQKQATVSFTFNLPMTTPIRLQDSLSGTIDLGTA